MFALYLTLMAVLVSGLGSRDQVTLGQYTQAHGSRASVLVIALALAVVTAAVAAWAAMLIAPMLVPRARIVLAAIALALAGFESILIAPGRRPKEPTHSLFAFSVVMGFHQMTDAARFLIFAIGVGTNAPMQAGAGGAIGGAALVLLAWWRPDLVINPRMRWARRGLGLILLPLGGYMWLDAMQMV
jgi:hypothetical protein